MDSTLTLLLSVGLCLHCKVRAQTEIFPRPTLWALPSPVVTKGADVTLRCQGRLGSDRFQLWKDAELREERNDSLSQADFVLRKVDDWRDARSYRCRSGKGPVWSEYSEPMILMVTGVLPKPNIEASADSLISPGKAVTIWCQMPQQFPIQDYSFVLLDAKSLEPLLLQIPAGHRTEFLLPSVGTEDTGSYSCIYYKKTPPHRASHLSSAMELTVLGQLPRPTLWAQPGLVVVPGTKITLWCSRPRLSSPKEVTFTLWKTETWQPLQYQNSADLWTGFSLPSVRPEDTGSYRCTYKDRTASGTQSEFSEALELVVTGSLPKPSLSALPGQVVDPGQHVTLQCRKPPRSALWRATFTLLKVGSPQPLQSQSTSGSSAYFPLLSVRAKDAGKYTCVYSERIPPYQVSEPSDALEICMTDTFQKPSLSAWPGLEVASGTNVTLLCWGPSWIPRFALYKEGVEGILHSMDAHEDQGRFFLTHVTSKDSGNYSYSYQLGTNESLWKQPSDALELLVREVRDVLTEYFCTPLPLNLRDDLCSREVIKLGSMEFQVPQYTGSEKGEESTRDEESFSCECGDCTQKDYTVGNAICIGLATLVLIILGFILSKEWKTWRRTKGRGPKMTLKLQQPGQESRCKKGRKTT